MAEQLSMPKDKAAVMEPLPTAEKKVPVKLLYDVWDHDGNHIKTNVKVLDEYGNPKVKLNAQGHPVEYETEQVIVELPVSLAKALIAEKKAERADPMPE